MKKSNNRARNKKIMEYVYKSFVGDISWEFAAMQIIAMFDRALHNVGLMTRGKRKNGR